MRMDQATVFLLACLFLSSSLLVCSRGSTPSTSLSEMEQEAQKKCGDHIVNLQGCAPDGIAFYEFRRCREERDKVEICLGQYGRDEAVLKELKKEYRLNPIGGKGTKDL